MYRPLPFSYTSIRSRIHSPLFSAPFSPFFPFPAHIFPPHGCSSQALRHCLIQGGAFLQPSANPGAALLQPPPASHSHWLALSWAPGPQPGLEGPVGGDYDADHFVMCSPPPRLPTPSNASQPHHTSPRCGQTPVMSSGRE